MKAPASEIGSDRWRVYLLECADGSYYCGMTVDVAQRIEQHNSGKGSKYIRGRRQPAKLIGYSRIMSMGKALVLEYRIKRLPKGQKLVALNEGDWEMSELSDRLRVVGHGGDLRWQAADEIDRLTAENERLRLENHEVREQATEDCLHMSEDVEKWQSSYVSSQAELATARATERAACEAVCREREKSWDASANYCMTHHTSGGAYGEAVNSRTEAGQCADAIAAGKPKESD